jgi:hypothetical protein
MISYLCSFPTTKRDTKWENMIHDLGVDDDTHTIKRVVAINIADAGFRHGEAA